MARWALNLAAMAAAGWAITAIEVRAENADPCPWSLRVTGSNSSGAATTLATLTRDDHVDAPAGALLEPIPPRGFPHLLATLENPPGRHRVLSIGERLAVADLPDNAVLHLIASRAPFRPIETNEIALVPGEALPNWLEGASRSASRQVGDDLREPRLVVGEARSHCQIEIAAR